jgi:cell division septation protein DedD
MLAATAGSPDYATGLYWRAALASTAADAERDYRRVIVDYPFSPHSGDALLALAQLEMARGDRESAIDHLQRFLLQQPNDPQRIRAGISLGRMLLDQNQLARGCAVLVRTRASLGDTAVEVRNQVDYYAARCVGVDTVPPPTAPAKPTPAPAKPTPAPDTTAKRRDSTHPAHPAPGRDSAARSSTKPPSTTAPNDAKGATKRYTVQVAAYDTKEAANQLSTRLAARGVVARVVDIGHAPYRVRVGRYATDADATAAARELKKKGIEGFVTTTDNETAPGSTKR